MNNAHVISFAIYRSPETNKYLRDRLAQVHAGKGASPDYYLAYYYYLGEILTLKDKGWLKITNVSYYSYVGGHWRYDPDRKKINKEHYTAVAQRYFNNTKIQAYLDAGLDIFKVRGSHLRTRLKVNKNRFALEDSSRAIPSGLILNKYNEPTFGPIGLESHTLNHASFCFAITMGVIVTQEGMNAMSTDEGSYFKELMDYFSTPGAYSEMSNWKIHDPKRSIVT